MDEKAEQKAAGSKRDEALVERLFRRVLDRVGAVVDRKLGREFETQTGFTTSRLIERMNHLIDERVREDPRRGRIAPHHLKLKIEWGTHSEAPPDTIKELEHEVLAAAINHINDQRLRTLAPVNVETIVDIFTTGIAVDPTYGEFEDELKQEDEAQRREAEGLSADVPKADLPHHDVLLHVREHPLFVREARDIVCEVPISITQAALGSELEVPTLEGTARVKIPAGTQSGQVFRLKGQGIPDLNGYGRGDELVRVLVETPKKLSARQRDLLEEFARLSGEEVHPLSKSFLEKVKSVLG